MTAGSSSRVDRASAWIYKSVNNQAIIEGIDNANGIRDQIMTRVRRSTTTGLGDEAHPPANATAVWSAAHLTLLREIRDAAACLCHR